MDKDLLAGIAARSEPIQALSAEPMSEFNSNDLLRCADAMNKEKKRLPAATRDEKQKAIRMGSLLVG